MRAETRKAAQQAIARFEADYGAKYPKAVASLRRDETELLAFFDFPAQHWVHLRTANVIESPFATVRLRQRVTRMCLEGQRSATPLDRPTALLPLSRQPSSGRVSMRRS